MSKDSNTADPTLAEPTWPAASGRRIVFLLDAASGFEEKLLMAWIARHCPDSVSRAAFDAVNIPASRRRHWRRDLSRLEALLAGGEDPLLAPLRIAWLAPERDGERSARFRDLLALSDPRDPGLLRQRWILRRWPERCRIVAGEPALASAVSARWSGHHYDGNATAGLAAFVVRQAHLALERSERRLRGARYKVPRLIHEAILERAAFRDALIKLALELGWSERKVLRRAARCLREIAATHSPFVIDLSARLIHKLYTRSYGEALHYDRAQLTALYASAQRHPLVFLPSHKSHLDHLVLQYALHENGLPPNHAAGGINMNFFPVGPLVRRSGVFFIRRSFRDDLIYKLVLRSYLDYLIEKRFPLEWYIEGGRSRSGKLLPPRFGLLSYVVDAYRRGCSEDVICIPVSIAYDQIQDVGTYSAEQQGAAGERQSFGWFLRALRAVRQRYGEISLHFGEPVPLSRFLGPAAALAKAKVSEESLDLQKLAFEICVRINRVTPITAVSLVAMALLETGGRALTQAEIEHALRNLLTFVERRGLPITSAHALATSKGVRRTLEALVANGVVACFAEGPEAVYAIARNQEWTAAYYRNTVIHFFITAAIAELALLRAGESDVSDPVSEFWHAAMHLRDLLKFEFFFPEKENFRRELRAEITLYAPNWESELQERKLDCQGLLRRFRPFHSHRVLRPFLEAYAVVAEMLERTPAGTEIRPSEFLTSCLALGKQALLQRRIRSAESVSKVLFQNGLALASNRKLCEMNAPGLTAQRTQFADEIRRVLRRLDAIEALVASRGAGLIE